MMEEEEEQSEKSLAWITTYSGKASQMQVQT